MKTKANRSFLNNIPSAVQSILWFIITTLILFGLGEGVGNIFHINEEIFNAIPYIIVDILIAVGCFYIVKWNPKSVWYVPLICNAAGIIAAIIEPSFWRTSLWMTTIGGWVLSIIASYLGARAGKMPDK